MKAFYRRAEPLLDHPTIWFGEEIRARIAVALATVTAQFGYTVWACAVLRNHVHLVTCRHRDEGEPILRIFMEATRQALVGQFDIPATHPVWADRPYVVFLYTPEDVRTRVRYVQNNPVKEGLGTQEFLFVKPYDNWPFHRRRI